MTGSYSIDDLIQYISWEHFFFTWKVSAQSEAAGKLKEEAIALLDELKDSVNVNFMLKPFNAHSDGDDIIVNQSVRVPFLRQQEPGNDGFCLCMSDYIKDSDDKLYVFATTVQQKDVQQRIMQQKTPQQGIMQQKTPQQEFMPQTTMPQNERIKVADDPYKALLIQTLSDRLAEAAAERLQAEVEKTENLPPASIIRPAVGYPSIPDMSINFIIDQLCDFRSIGISLTESGMMKPHSSVSGFMILNPHAHYFSVGKISEDQLVDYARRRGFSEERMRVFVNA
jgi:cobalamin-dependent methionine synthase I